MSKRKSLLFEQDTADWFNDIEVLAGKKHHADDLWSIYAAGYKEAANLICEQIINKRVLKKYAMIYPIIYLYRHYLELQFKNIISLTTKALSLSSMLDNSYVETKSFSKNHNLLELYSVCFDKLKIFAVKIGDPAILNEEEDFLELKEIIQEFEEYDKSSQSFRYPIDRKNNSNLQKISTINIKNVYDIINKSTETFDGIEMWLDVQIDSINEFILDTRFV